MRCRRLMVTVDNDGIGCFLCLTCPRLEGTSDKACWLPVVIITFTAQWHCEDGGMEQVVQTSTLASSFGHHLEGGLPCWPLCSLPTYITEVGRFL
jgi:hypothetical protein